ncbi:MAG: AAA family ATPase [Thermoproteota archaeon]|nr:AAA family ATPase [Thermoproteota archaeon]
MNKQDLRRISEEIEKENWLFANKLSLDNLTIPSQIIGRETKTKELVRFLLGYKKGLVVPFVSVYGRSGSGKSTIVRFVCENLDDEYLDYAFVNLRKARTVFGCANLILTELDKSTVKSAQGINAAIEQISKAIEQRLSNERSGSKKLIVLVLDEFDVLMHDKRGKPSDFIYKLLVMEEKLREKGYLMCIIAISNNVMADYEIDDRVRSRIGTSEVFFEPYSRDAVFAILEDRAAKAFSSPVSSEVLRYCADQSSREHGDARRAIDLLRVAAEIAGKKGQNINKAHIDAATDKLQKDRVSTTLSSASYHLKIAALALARISYLTEESWQSTSTVYKQYCHIQAAESTVKQLTYRRISELLTELENMGLVASHTSSKGRYGYGTEYKLLVPPETIGSACASPEWWDEIVQKKSEHEKDENQTPIFAPRSTTNRKKSVHGSSITNMFDDFFASTMSDSWEKFVGPK